MYSNYRQKLSLYLTCLILSLSFFAQIALAAQDGTAIQAAQYEELVSRVRTEGAVKIIVRLNIDFVPEGFLKHANQRALQRAAIKNAQQRLTGELARFNVKVRGALKYTPKIGLEVNEPALTFLISSPLVDRIWEDRPVSPFIADTIPLTGADDALLLGYDGSGQVIAILDTGVRRDHEFLGGSSSRIVSEACFSTYGGTKKTLCPNGGIEDIGPGTADPTTVSNCYDKGKNICGHGTHVAGIASGYRNSGLRGVAPNVNIISIQVFHRENSTTACYPDPAPCLRAYWIEVEKGLDYIYGLRDGFDIAAVNLSFGESEKFTAPCDTHQFKDEVDNLRSVGIAAIAASGNNGYTDGLVAPACISSVVSVGNTTKSDDVYTLTRASNSADFLDLLAPGTSIFSSIVDSAASYGLLTGTSMSAPHVTGAWAVLAGANPDATVDEILGALRDTGVPVQDRRNNIIKPRIDVLNALYAITEFADLDGDAIFDKWELINFGGLATANQTTDYDGDGLLDHDEFAMNADPKNPDTDGDGVPDGWEADSGQDPILNDSDLDPDGDGFSNLMEYRHASDLLDPGSFPLIITRQLREGFNLINAPSNTHYLKDAFTFLMAIDNGMKVEKRVSRYNRETGVFEEAVFNSDGAVNGVNFSIIAGEGLELSLSEDTEISISQNICPLIDLKPGFNLVSTPCDAGNVTAFSFLRAIGDETVILNIQRFNPDTGEFETAGYFNDGIVGVDFPLRAGDGCFVTMLKEVNGIDPKAPGVIVP